MKLYSYPGPLCPETAMHIFKYFKRRLVFIRYIDLKHESEKYFFFQSYADMTTISLIEKWRKSFKYWLFWEYSNNSPQ